MRRGEQVKRSDRYRGEVSASPFEPPRTLCCLASSSPSVSRASLVQLIHDFLLGKVEAGSFEEQLLLYNRSNDSVLRYVAQAIEDLYDEDLDEVSVGTKLHWDFVQRLLLVLSTERQVRIETKVYWSVEQLGAAVALGFFAWSACFFGWGPHLFLLTAALGLFSICLSRVREKRDGMVSPFNSIIYPFATFDELEAAYQASNFRKMKYDKQRIEHRSRARFEFFDKWFQDLIVVPLCSPLVLLFQMIPPHHTRIRVFS